MATKYFLDTEFIEDGKTIDLISLALVCEDGRVLYLQNIECQFAKASDWVWRNVFIHLNHFHMSGARECTPKIGETKEFIGGLTGFNHKCGGKDGPCPWATRNEIREAVLDFCNPDKYGKPEFWGYYADYDWVVFCQLFGRMIELPEGFPMYCHDLKQIAYEIKFRLPRPEKEIHNALVDALQVKEWYGLIIRERELLAKERELLKK